MKNEQLLQYKGISLYPKDFDEFWDNEIKKVDSYLAETRLTDKENYELKEKNFGISFADCFELYFKSIDKAKIFSKVIVPKNRDKKIPFLFAFHGYQSQSADWSQYLGYVASGMGVALMDVRGQAGKSQDIGNFEGITVKGHIIRGAVSGRENLFYKNVFLDVYILSKIIENLEYTDKEKMYTLGASQGGALATVCAALNENIKRSFVIYPFLSDYKKVMELKITTDAYNELYRYFKYIDPFHETEDKILEALSYIDVKNFSHRVKGKVMFVASLMDDVCPPETQMAVYNNFICDKEILFMSEYTHEDMNVKIKDKIYNFITDSKINGHL